MYCRSSKSIEQAKKISEPQDRAIEIRSEIQKVNKPKGSEKHHHIHFRPAYILWDSKKVKRK